MRPRERDRQIHPTRRPTVVEVHGVAFSGIRTQASCRTRNFELTHGVYRASAPTATATNSRRQLRMFVRSNCCLCRAPGLVSGRVCC